MRPEGGNPGIGPTFDGATFKNVANGGVALDEAHFTVRVRSGSFQGGKGHTSGIGGAPRRAMWAEGAAFSGSCASGGGGTVIRDSLPRMSETAPFADSVHLISSQRPRGPAGCHTALEARGGRLCLRGGKQC
jgi:hypothetical protein